MPVMFVHLRLHSEFSVVDSTLRIDEAVTAAAQDGQPALALTDLNNLFGAVKFYRAAIKAGVQPILGAEVLIEDLYLSGLVGRDLPVKVLGDGDASKALKITAHKFSKQAVEKITAAGGEAISIEG